MARVCRERLAFNSRLACRGFLTRELEGVVQFVCLRRFGSCCAIWISFTVFLMAGGRDESGLYTQGQKSRKLICRISGQKASDSLAQRDPGLIRSEDM